MIRQYRYDMKTNKVHLKSIPCICEDCLDGNFGQCCFYDQQIIEADIIETKDALQLRKDSYVEEIVDHEDYSEADVFLRNNHEIDIDFLNRELEDQSQNKTASPQQDSKNLDSPDPSIVDSPNYIGSVELSSPNPDCITSSQKENLVEFADFGSLDDRNEDEYLLNRLNSMSDSEYIEPKEFGTDKKCLKAIFETTGLVEGFSLDFFGNIILQHPNMNMYYIFIKIT